MLQEVSEVVGRNQVIDADKFDIAVFQPGPEDQPTDSTKSVNSNLQSHRHCSIDKM